MLPHHLNPNGVCHGGMIATFCDVYLAISAIHQGGVAARMMPTVSLSMDFLVPVPAGAWVEGRAELLRQGRRLVFAQGLLSVEGRTVVRANGVFSAPGEASSPNTPT